MGLLSQGLEAFARIKRGKEFLLHLSVLQTIAYIILVRFGAKRQASYTSR